MNRRGAENAEKILKKSLRSLRLCGSPSILIQSDLIEAVPIAQKIF